MKDKLKVLIVDDIHWIRKGIIALLEDQYDFQYFEAQDGEEALGMIFSMPFDIVITDIRMPNKDGIELLKEIRQLGREVPFLIISGFSEFKYAEQAVNYKAAGYLLKPIEANQLYEKIDAILTAIMHTRQVRSIAREADQMREHLQNMQRVEMLRQSLIEGQGPISDDAAKDLFPEKVFAFCMFLLYINPEQLPGNSLSVFNDADLIRYCIGNIAEEVCQDFNPIVFAHPAIDNQIVVLLGHGKHDFLKIEKTHIAQKILEHAEKYLNASLSIGISQTLCDLSPDLYVQAQRALQTRFVHNNRGVFNYDLIMKAEPTISNEELKNLEIYLNSYDADQAQKIIARLFAPESMGEPVALYVQKVCHIIMEIAARKYGTTVYEKIESEFGKIKFICLLQNHQMIADRVMKNIELVLASDGDSSQVFSSLIDQVIEYLHNHYFEEISLKQLADSFNVNYSYLSNLFKQTTGQNIVNYLTVYRLNIAAKLLETTKTDIATLAKSCGYSDLNYFYRLFKKHFGSTPLSFRKQKNIQ